VLSSSPKKRHLSAFCKRPYRVSKKKSPFPASSEEWKEETKKKLRGDKGARGVLSFLRTGIVFANKMPFSKKINNK
jgi:hypothetical protein